MKKYVLFFALLITVGGAGAQNTTNRDMAVDTVDCSNAPYMFNPMPPQVSLNNCGTGSMWIGPVGSRQHLGTVAVRYFSHKATIFGVAATMDTFSEPRYNIKDYFDEYPSQADTTDKDKPHRGNVSGAIVYMVAYTLKTRSVTEISRLKMVLPVGG